MDLLYRAHAIQSHRGPDNQSERVFKLNDWQIGIAHQRLAVIDLQDISNQPMHYQDRGSIVFNGEIYNYLEIKDELIDCGFSFETDSDTEVLLVGLHYYGLEEMLRKLNGMWAFCWYDKENNKVILCRDRFGIKPLNYYIEGDTLYFASEVKTILEMSNTTFELNEQKIGEYLSQSLLATDENTFFKQIKRLPLGTYAEFDGSLPNINFRIKKYWDINITEQKVESEEELVKEIRELFEDAVNICLRSDVPVGVLLSGGIDSSAITAMMNKGLKENENLHIFSAVSDDKRFDESYFIDSVANHIQKPVHKVNLDFGPDEAMKLLDRVNWYNDEPVGSFSNVSHYLLMEKAKELGITVILSGQGADEILCGYKKFLGFYLQQLVYQKKYAKAFQVYREFKKNKTVINQFNLKEAKRYLPKRFKPKEINILGERVLKKYQPISVGIGKEYDVQKRQVLDVEKFSVPVITQYEDRMSMVFAREIRVPFLDYRLVERFISLPTEYKLRNGWTKYIFRKSIEDVLPKEVVWRKDKQGFVNPQGEWLKHELKDTVLKYFEKDNLMFKMGLVNHTALKLKYEKYCNQPVDKGEIWFKDIFAPLALESWLRQYQTYIKI
ncbi:asparagine synthase (glutamine-hydrolyzing) [Lysinibacillus sp. FSL H8-0500]|uniref:asparagine synthase (glutamine-hydrolyzing) n=1 Tax=Lysinibacillus sp. FSL H8-0500 TaxID=2921393 RepID=UPI0031012A8A